MAPAWRSVYHHSVEDLIKSAHESYSYNMKVSLESFHILYVQHTLVLINSARCYCLNMHMLVTSINRTLSGKCERVQYSAMQNMEYLHARD